MEDASFSRVPAKCSRRLLAGGATDGTRLDDRDRGKTEKHAVDDHRTTQIHSSLGHQSVIRSALGLYCNRVPKRIFQGMKPGLDGFVISRDQYRSLIEKEVVPKSLLYPYATPSDLLSANSKPANYFVELTDQGLPPVAGYGAGQQKGPANTLHDQIVATTVSPLKSDASKIDRDSRWRLRSNKSELILGIDRLRGRYIACSRASKHLIFVFLRSEIRPCDKLQAFLFDDDYSFGLLQSGVYGRWFRAKRAQMKSDFRYCMQSTFHTFPWPQSPTASQIDAVSEAGRAIRLGRDKSIANTKGGVLAFYRTLELPDKHLLKDAHAALDAAILNAYGFSAKRDLVEELLQLNQEVANREGKGDSVTAPGAPKDYPSPVNLVTKDCIKPEE
jgi:hypothetical protein